MSPIKETIRDFIRSAVRQSRTEFPNLSAMQAWVEVTAALHEIVSDSSHIRFCGDLQKGDKVDFIHEGQVLWGEVQEKIPDLNEVSDQVGWGWEIAPLNPNKVENDSVYVSYRNVLGLRATHPETQPSRHCLWTRSNTEWKSGILPVPDSRFFVLLSDGTTLTETDGSWYSTTGVGPYTHAQKWAVIERV